MSERSAPLRRAAAAVARTVVPSTRSARTLLLASFVDSVGTGLYLAGSALFFTQVVGLSAVQVGIGQSLFGVAGLLGTVPIGRLADRFGGRNVVVVLYLWQAVCFGALAFVREAPVYFVLAFLIGLSEWATGPIVRGLVSALEEQGTRMRTTAQIFTVRNLGFTIGGLLVAVAALTNTERAYMVLILGDAVSFVVAAVFLSRLRTVPRSGSVLQRRPRLRGGDLRFAALAALNGGLALNGVLVAIGLPLWIATATDAPPALVGLVLVVNTVMVIALQIPFSRGREGLVEGARMQRLGGRFLSASCLVVAFTTGGSGPMTIALLVFGAALLTLGEISNSTGSWKLSYSLLPEGRENYYLSVFELGRTMATTVGPVLVTWAVIGNGTPGWIGLAVFFFLVGESVVAFARRSGREQA